MESAGIPCIVNAPKKRPRNGRHNAHRRYKAWKSIATTTHVENSR